MTGVMGFVAQCEICPQKAILTDQPDGWVCPRCTEVTAPDYVKRVDPFADAILREVDRAPHNPFIVAFVNGRRFRLCGFTRTEGHPLSTAWVDEELPRFDDHVIDLGKIRG